MKRSAMIEHIQEELLEFFISYRKSSDKRKSYVLKYRAEGLLDMLEGFGMLPPLNEDYYHHMDNQDRVDANRIRMFHSWEDETK